MHIIGFNGPPRCGKDTLAKMVADYMDKQGVSLPVKFDWLSLPLRKIAYQMVGLNYESPDCIDYEVFKTTRFPAFGDVTGRQLMIDVSESFLKQVYGIDIMAQMLLDRNTDFHGILLVPDCGFQCEVNPLESHVGINNLYMVQVFRDGCDFKNDSRELVHTNGGMQQVFNTEGLDHLHTEAGRIYGRLVNNRRWKL